MRAFLLLVFAGCSTDTFVTGDASPPDASSLDGGGSDGAAVCTSTAQPCSQLNGTFCADFDEATFSQGWDAVDATGGFVVQPTQHDATTCPTSVSVTVPQLAAGQTTTGPHGYLTHALGGSNSITISFDVFLPVLPAVPSLSDGLSFFALRTSADATWSIRLERSADTVWSLRVHQGSTTSPSVPVPNILMGAWNHMSLSAELKNDASGSVSLTYQTNTGPSSVSIPSVQTVAAASSPTPILNLGVLAMTQTSQQWFVLYDSVLVQAN